MLMIAACWRRTYDELLFFFPENSCRTRLATCFLVSLSEVNSSRESVRAVPIDTPVLACTLTTHWPGCPLLTRIFAFDASADFFASCSVDEVTGFGGRKALKAETETLFPPPFELTMMTP